jgi:uncharacterized membrane protein SirB2
MPDLPHTYPLLKHLHQTCVALSLSLFAARWLGVLSGATWPMHSSVRLGSVAMDTVLLTAGLTLWVLGGWHAWHHPWLGSKLVLLVAYVLLGSLALKRARTRRGKLVYGVIALAVAGHMVASALHHHPAGAWAGTA